MLEQSTFYRCMSSMNIPIKSLKSFLRSRLPEPFVLHYTLWQARRAFDEPELELLPFLPHGGCFLDVGANIGIWSKAAAPLFSRVYAFEPDRNVAAQLARTMPRNVEVHNLALSNRTGTAQLAVPVLDGKEVTTRASLEYQLDPRSVVREVEISTLDALQLTNISVIKIDVEGHEAATLEGASASILRDQPVLIVEIEERHHPGGSEAIFERLFGLGYSCIFLRHGRVERFDIALLKDLQRPGQALPVGQKKPSGYVNNFIFVPCHREDIVESITTRNPKRLAEARSGG